MVVDECPENGRVTIFFFLDIFPSARNDLNEKCPVPTSHSLTRRVYTKTSRPLIRVSLTRLSRPAKPHTPHTHGFIECFYRIFLILYHAQPFIRRTTFFPSNCSALLLESFFIFLLSFSVRITISLTSPAQRRGTTAVYNTDLLQIFENRRFPNV